ncbi:type II toxin-antitoxin system MqsA family antitoxin [Acidithiobacillus sp.]|uniref:type II toxin-antitoxin system MqsA family antitoxin n=1 Tax=Acidithiobacillus sp. TaxID=1872118 RepID=UPI0025B9A9DD|nr:type II toxin-antitoxin system MqsA family antitoxin [Acidithiobacillus sp.]MCK9188431.1 type II toxin-antitoxin system MqsA family antitoxin [Acidithiobacillus sp.]MCK9358852.1 type II toxin-antitoxin system MqsA family antitoxin [Acidithiobacillus sp.]
MPYTYQGETIIIPEVTGDYCRTCAESLLDAGETDRVMRKMRSFSLHAWTSARAQTIPHPAKWRAPGTAGGFPGEYHKSCPGPDAFPSEHGD